MKDKAIKPYDRVKVESSMIGITRIDECDIKNITPIILKENTTTIAVSRIVYGFLNIIQFDFKELYLKMEPHYMDELMNILVEKLAQSIFECQTEQDLIYMSCALYSLLVDYSIMYKCSDIPSIDMVGDDISNELYKIIRDVRKVELK